MKGLARTGDVAATASTATGFPNETAPTASGAWAPVGAVTETTVTVAVTDAKEVVVKASGNFKFTGTATSGGAPFTSDSTVTLSASPRVLKVDGQDPLVDGDEAKDTFGNKLTVSSSATWRTD